jgi:hypothetical protein
MYVHYCNKSRLLNGLQADWIRGLFSLFQWAGGRPHASQQVEALLCQGEDGNEDDAECDRLGQFIPTEATNHQRPGFWMK